MNNENPQRADQCGSIVAVAGLLALIAGFVFSPKDAYPSYLTGFLYWIGLTLGCLPLLMIHNLTGGKWGFPMRPFWNAGLGTLPLMTLLVVPLFCGLKYLYPWAGLAFSHGAEVIRQRAIYLNTPGMVVRAVVSFAVWIGLAWLLVWRSMRRTGEADKARSRTDLISGLGLVVFAVVTSFAFVDWLMAVEPAWYSSIFPAIVLVGQILCALAFGFFYSLPKFYERPDSGELLNQVSNLLLAFVLMWTYLSISQIIIIYAGDLPHEIGWYLRRTRGGWLWLGLSLAVFQFGLPFVLLLFREVKKSRYMLITITLMQLVAQAIATFWYTAPAYRHVLRLRWTDPVAFFGIGLAWLLIFRRQARREPEFQTNQF
jgi:hypothetical protein